MSPQEQQCVPLIISPTPRSYVLDSHFSWKMGITDVPCLHWLVLGLSRETVYRRKMSVPIPHVITKNCDVCNNYQSCFCPQSMKKTNINCYVTCGLWRFLTYCFWHSGYARPLVLESLNNCLSVIECYSEHLLDYVLQIHHGVSSPAPL